MYERIAGILHLLICKRDHQRDCQWYVEDQHADYTNQPDHKEWFTKAEGIVRLSGLTPEELEKLLRNLISVVGKINYIKSRNKNLCEIIDLIIIESTKVKNA